MGGQTCKTIQRTLDDENAYAEYKNVFVLLRVYELADEDESFIHDITYATNSQNPVDFRDLRSNDDLQRQLEIGMKGLGYSYQRKREKKSHGRKVLQSSVVAESVLAVWREKPQQAKFYRKDHFGRLYKTVFKGLNAPQAVLATFIFRHAENERKHPSHSGLPDFIPYGSHYIAMLMGRALLNDMNLNLLNISHRNFKKLWDQFEEEKQNYHKHAIEKINAGLKNLYGQQKISLQQLAATFRRGDLLARLS